MLLLHCSIFTFGPGFRLRRRPGFPSPQSPGRCRLHAQAAHCDGLVAQCGGRRRTALRQGYGHSATVVDSVRVAAAKRPDRKVDQGQPDNRCGKGGAAPGPGECRRSKGFLLSHRPGQRFGQPPEERHGNARAHADLGRFVLHALYRSVDRELYA